jgi:hypothetical protein
MDIESLIARTSALSWDDPSSQIESLSKETSLDECLPLVGHVISHKTHNNQSVLAALSKAWEFAVPFSFAVLGPNKFLFKFSKPEHLSRIHKQVTWNVNGFLIILKSWHPHAALHELPLNTTPFWIQVHGLPLINMTIKTVISIGKGLGNFIKVEDSCADSKPFRSYLRLLVELDVRIPLKPGFIFLREGGEPLDIFLKYERLDIYCCSCGRIGHKSTLCNAAPAEKVPEKYVVSLLVNIFSNVLPSSSSRTSATLPYPQHHPNSSQIRAPESSNLSQSNLTPVTNAPSIPAPAHAFPMHQKISLPLVTSLHTSPTTYDLSVISSTAPSTNFTATKTVPPPPPLQPGSQPQNPVTSTITTSLDLNQNVTSASSQKHPSLAIVLPFDINPSLSLPASSTCIFSQSVLNTPPKIPSKKHSNSSKKVNSTKNSLFPTRLHKPGNPSPPGCISSQLKKKRARSSGDLLPYKKSSDSLLQKAPDPVELEAPLPMDATPHSTLQLPPRPFFKAVKHKKQVLLPAPFSATELLDSSHLSGDHVVSPSCK